MPTVYLIRHAQALDRRAYNGTDDRDRPLTPKGHAQASDLADTLANAGIHRIISSPATRCVQTVTPLSQQLNIALEVDPRLIESTTINLDDFIDLETVDADHTLVLCAHGDNIPELLDNLNIECDRCQKASMWKVALNWGQASGTYRAPGG
ncbi:MAG: SixA phosphatase family protein [Phycisphaerales bacterium]